MACTASPHNSSQSLSPIVIPDLIRGSTCLDSGPFRANPRQNSRGLTRFCPVSVPPYCSREQKGLPVIPGAYGESGVSCLRRSRWIGHRNLQTTNSGPRTAVGILIVPGLVLWLISVRISADFTRFCTTNPDIATRCRSRTITPSNTLV